MFRQCHSALDTNDFIELIVDCMPQKFAVASEVIFSSIVLQTPASAFNIHSYPCAFSCTTIPFVLYIVPIYSLLSEEASGRSAHTAQLNAGSVEAGWWVPLCCFVLLD